LKGCVHIFRVIVFYKMREKIWKKNIVVHNKFEMMKLHALSWQVKIVERILFAILKATCIDKHILRTRRHNIFRAPTHLPINYLSNIIYYIFSKIHISPSVKSVITENRKENTQMLVHASFLQFNMNSEKYPRWERYMPFYFQELKSHYTMQKNVCEDQSTPNYFGNAQWTTWKRWKCPWEQPLSSKTLFQSL
jgi:hypothetical protein